MRDPFLVGIPASEMRMADPARPRPPRERVTLIDIAVALDVTEHAIRARAKREGWIHITASVAGCRRAWPRRLYRVAGLPADVRDALENSR